MRIGLLGTRMALALFLLSYCGESQEHRLIGPDRKPLPGRPGGARLFMDQTVTPMAGYLTLLQIADVIEAQQRSNPSRLSGTFGTPQVSWIKTSDTYYTFELDGMTVGVTRFPPGVRSIAIIKAQARNQPQQMYGVLAMFAASLASCSDAFWAQYVGRDDKFVTKSSRTPGHKELAPEIDVMAPYKIQRQTGPGSAFMDDFAGAQGPLGASPEQIAVIAIAWYLNDGRISTGDVVQLTARYHFWSYAICLKPSYVVAGHFEWGYTTRLDLLNVPHVKTSEDGIRWVPNR